MNIAHILKESCILNINHMPLYGECIGSKPSMCAHDCAYSLSSTVILPSGLGSSIKEKNSLVKVLTGELANSHIHLLSLLFSIKNGENMVKTDAQSVMGV